MKLNRKARIIIGVLLLLVIIAVIVVVALTSGKGGTEPGVSPSPSGPVTASPNGGSSFSGISPSPITNGTPSDATPNPDIQNNEPATGTNLTKEQQDAIAKANASPSPVK